MKIIQSTRKNLNIASRQASLYLKRWIFMAIFLILVAGTTFFFLSQHTTGTIKDIDGNIYKTVQIGNQIWMAENLRAQSYANGDSIPVVTGNKDWLALTDGARCFYNNMPENEKRYGMLYNWYAASDTRGLCPKGWRIPTDKDWQTLSDYLGGEKTAGGKLRTTLNFGEHATNSSGFSALPAGYRMYNGKYMYQGDYAGFWSSTNGNEEFAWLRFLNNYDTKITRLFFGKKNGLSCRCVTDVEKVANP